MIRREFRELERKAKLEDAHNQTQKPSCFTDRDWQEWLDLSFCCSSALKKTDFCRDCTPEFKERMTASFKCDHIDVKFIEKSFIASGQMAIEYVETYGKRPLVRK